MQGWQAGRRPCGTSRAAVTAERETTFSAMATASLRSRIAASAPAAKTFASLRGRLPGTKRDCAGSAWGEAWIAGSRRVSPSPLGGEGEIQRIERSPVEDAFAGRAVELYAAGGQDRVKRADFRRREVDEALRRDEKRSLSAGAIGSAVRLRSLAT